MVRCAHESHELYPGNCPECNPEGYQALLGQSSPGQAEETAGTAKPASRAQRSADAKGTHGNSYSDAY